MIKLARNLAHILKTYDFTQATHNIRTYGFSTFLENAIREVSKSPSQSVEKEFKFPDSSMGLPEEWRDYGMLRESISKMEKSRLTEVRSWPAEIESIDEKKIASYAESLEFSENAAPQISLVIPVYNNIKFTIECLLSIRKYTEQLSYEVIIVDDCSTDETGEILSNIRGLIYAKNSENLGFLRSSNLGATKARGKYIVFLNNDAQATFEWLRELINTFIDFQDVGAVGPKILFPDGRLQEAGALINPDCTTSLIGYGDDPEKPRYNYVKDVEYCSGACLAIETEVFHGLGGFNDDLAPAYYEDVDLCLRIRQKGLRVLYNPKAVIVHHLNVSSNSIGNTYKTRCITRNRQKICDKWQSRIDELNHLRLIAFYLPQFHPIPENDRWWGKGFTEWRNVAKAKPNYEGHYQPHLPADLGFYDLRLEEVMEEQAELAKRYGISGFCYYYYWFGGKRLLERPIEQMLKSGKPDFPFCLCWANENWTRKWDGRDNEMLMAQAHSEEDDILLIKDVMRYMRNKNYIRINGKPLFLVYRINLFPDIRRTVRIWRDICRAEGVGEIYLAMVESFEHAGAKDDPVGYGFDASVEFPPHSSGASIQVPGKLHNANFKGVVLDYRRAVLNYAKKEVPDYVRFRTVMPSWDNTARRQNNSHSFAYSTPGSYQAWLEFILKQTREQNFGDERLVFINAWNEWAEGAHLEPDQRYGHGFLEATRNAMEAGLLKKNRPAS